MQLLLMWISRTPVQKFVSHRAVAFRPLQHVHENIYTANISEINPLHPDHFIIAMHPSSNEILLGEGEWLYNGIMNLFTNMSLIIQSSRYTQPVVLAMLHINGLHLLPVLVSHRTSTYGFSVVFGRHIDIAVMSIIGLQFLSKNHSLLYPLLLSIV